jgi:hypothetical protein
MTAATAVPPDVTAYLAAVRASLIDLPEAERDDLVSEVEASLVESIEEGAPIAARLGPPEEFAAELRAAAGLHEPVAQPRGPSRLALLAARLVRDPRVAVARRLGTDLAPIWWLARAYLAVGALAYVLDTGWSTRYPIVPRFGTAEMGVVLIGLAVVASVLVGLQMRRQGSPFPRLTAALNAALVLAVLPVALDVSDAHGAQAMLAAMTPAPAQQEDGLRYDGLRVENIYPYSRDGKLLHDVLLYDGTGRPIEIPANRGEDPDRRFVVTNGNRPLYNVFPIRYYEPGTKRVERPNASPFIEHPHVVTPPLPAKRR